MKLSFLTTLAALITCSAASTVQSTEGPVIRVIDGGIPGESTPSYSRGKTFIRIIGDRQDAVLTSAGKPRSRPQQDQSPATLDEHGTATGNAAHNDPEMADAEQESAALAATIEQLAATRTATHADVPCPPTVTAVTAKKITPSKKVTKNHKKRVKKRRTKCVCR
ncbi:MAG: hypothetical protein PHI31_10220 [Desulfuromonadaceae bacterium]|nr:hypothetical protein [Desulfuromonadaceae bacterium]